MKILVNGCSHTRASIPDLSRIEGEKTSWAVQLPHHLDCDVINLADSGKDNFIILEETQRYLLNKKDIDHVVVQLTEWERVSFFKRSSSFSMVPCDMESQFDRLNPDRPKYHFKIPGFSPEDFIIRKIGETGERLEIPIGDLSRFYERISRGTLLFNLYYYCSQNNIGLTVLPYYSMGDKDELEDAVFQSISLEIFLQENLSIGLYDYFAHLFPGYEKYFHLGSDAHRYIAKLVSEHILNNKRVEIPNHIEQAIRMKTKGVVVYDYTD